MRRLISALALILASCAITAAQDKQSVVALQPDNARLQSPAKPSPLMRDLSYVFRQTQESPFTRQADGRVQAFDTEFVFKSGALYFKLGVLDVLLPVPGGGASGCFTLDLAQRAEQLRRFIEQLPPKIESPVVR